MDSTILVVALGAMLAGFVQGLSGFAFGLVAMSVWAWTIDPHLAAAMSVFGALTGQILAAVTVRRGFHFAQLLPFLLGGLAGIPIGVAILPRLDVPMFKALLGLLLVIWCPLMLTAGQIRITVGGRVADGAAGIMGGIMSALGGFAGTIPTLWCTLRGFEKDTQRVIIQNFNLAILATTFVTYAWTGLATANMLPMFAIVAAAVVIPVLLGARLYIGISEANFRKIVLGLLTASGIALLVSATPVLLQRYAAS
jgi:uncharacterized membrane protein YfcA